MFSPLAGVLTCQLHACRCWWRRRCDHPLRAHLLKQPEPPAHHIARVHEGVAAGWRPTVLLPPAALQLRRRRRCVDAAVVPPLPAERHAVATVTVAAADDDDCRDEDGLRCRRRPVIHVEPASQSLADLRGHLHLDPPLTCPFSLLSQLYTVSPNPATEYGGPQWNWRPRHFLPFMLIFFLHFTLVILFP